MVGLKKIKGLISQKVSLEHFDLTRLQPSMALAEFVENYWIISWDLTNKAPYVQENLPHPSQHLVIDPQGKTGIFGATSQKFVYTLKDKGVIFGIKFWPGAFSAFTPSKMGSLSKQYVTLETIFNVNSKQLEQELLIVDKLEQFTSKIETMLTNKQPQLSLNSLKTRSIVEYIEQNTNIVSIDALTDEFSLSARSLQRLFNTYLGMTPKWVIERYRMLDAITSLNEGKHISLTELAHQLGYFDQAHFSKAFSALVGFPPSHYHFEK